jgi:hypothetical protein
MKTQKYWFPAKKFGWGWGFPCCWQGWLVYAAWIAMFFGGWIFLKPLSIDLFTVYNMVLSSAFYILVFIKGEKPRWRWGEDDP